MKDDNILGNANDISKEVDSILGEATPRLWRIKII